ncbi:type 2 lantipeptide synthetase LanM [Bacillus thuringiensis]
MYNTRRRGMLSLQNLLFSFERTQEEIKVSHSSIFEKNIELIYKNDDKLVEESIKNMLSMDDIEDLKSLYLDFSSKSTYKLDTFRKILKEIAEQPVGNIEENNNLFSSFLHKVSSCLTGKIIQSKKYKQMKHQIQDESAFFYDIEQQFQKRIYWLSYRTLVFDFHMNKQENCLQGDTEEQKLRHYNDTLLQDPKYVVAFFEKYPCLLRILSNEMRKHKKYIVELLKRYQEDRDEISRCLFNNIGFQKIKHIDIGMGDSHCDGRTTAILHLEVGKLLYKPRNSTPESMYTALMQDWNRNLDSEAYKIKTPNGILKKNYSWIEHIEYQTCTNQEDVHNFYKRMGVQMAFLYAFNGIDFHYENIIAHKGFPVLVDVECLFHIPPATTYTQNSLKDVQVKIQHEISNSVYSLGVLPVSRGENHVDNSGLGKTDKMQSVGKVPRLKTDTMKIEREYVQYAGSEQHRPRLDGKVVSVYEYTEDVMHGFEIAYAYIQHHKKVILHIMDNYKDTLMVRYLPKSTRTYGSILNVSVHPRFLHNSLDRELFMAKHCEVGNKPPVHDVLGKSEFMDLMNGDIPYFTHQIATKNVVTSNGKNMNNFFHVSPYDFVKQKIENLNDEDLQFQLKIIEGSITFTRVKTQDSIQKTVSINPAHFTYEFEQQEFFIDTAKKISDYLYTLAFTGEQEEKRTISWLDMLLGEKAFDLRAMDDSLYNGLSGMALMYLSMWVVTKEVKYLEIAEDIMYDMMNRIDDLPIDDPTLSIGAFTGVSSILYTLLNFHQFTQKNRYKEYAKKSLHIIQHRLQDDTNLDVIGGAAGALIVLMRYYELEQEQDILDTAKLCGEFLMQKAIHFTDQEVGWVGAGERALTGFSHGNAGIVYALQLLNKRIKSEDIHTVIKKGMMFENNHTLDDRWLDLRKVDKQIDICRWCHGSPGILVSRLELQKSEDEWISIQSKKDMEHAISNTLQWGFGTGNEKSICHGVMGNALIIMKYGQELQDCTWENISRNVMYESIKHLKVEKLKQPIEGNIDGLGLLTGLAGIAYGLLYACNQRLPNVTTLELGQWIPNESEIEAKTLNN